MRRHLFLFCFLCLLLSCISNSHEQPDTPSDTVKLSSLLTNSASTDTDKQIATKPDTALVKVKTKNKNNSSELTETVGVSDSELNGEPVRLSEEIAPEILSSNPDTIKELVRSHYRNCEQRFPRSIADNFQKGTSTERIYYPKLNYIIELYKDQNSIKPYKTANYSARKENDFIIVE